MKNKARVLAFYLPQFHPIPENDVWWGKGFTEWTNVGKAKPLFKGHYQPRVPADLGYYDLRVPETREAQANLAKEFGVEGFCYWHYWFGNGKRLLERVFDEVLASKSPDFPFCLAWANETWKGFVHGMTNRNILIEQKYPGKKDYEEHFYAVLPAFQDSRYVKVDGKPLFMIYKPLEHPEMNEFIKLWRILAKQNGLEGIYFVGHSSFQHEVDNVLRLGLDSVNLNGIFNYHYSRRKINERVITLLKKKVFGIPYLYMYSKMIKYALGEREKEKNVYPTIFPNWDHSPRSKSEGIVFHNSSPELFKELIKNSLDLVQHKEEEHRILFLKSWNEWAEGNYLEPDLKYGLKYLEALKEVIVK